MPPIATLPIVVQRGSYRLQLSNLKIGDEDLPQLLQRATTELTNNYAQSQGKRAVFGDVPLIEVTFNKNLITDASCAAIVNFIAQNANIQSVELLGNGLTDASAPHIVKMITTLPIQRLKIGDNAFTHIGAGIIGDALKSSHKGFLQLHIGGNPIGDEGVRVLCEACLVSRVEVLGLRDVAFGTDGWEALGGVVASATTGVHDYQLRGNTLSLECAAAFAKGISSSALNTSHAFKLTVLSIGNCSIDGPSAKALFGVLDRAHNLVQIDLSNNPFGDEGVSHLVSWLASGHRNHLQWLSLQKSGITAAGIKAMTASSRCDTVLAALKYLDLSLNNLGEEGSAAVATIIQWGMVLEKINLRRCMLAGPRLSEICSAVNHHPTLKEIDFASNFSGSDNAKHWADIIFANSTLEHLVLTDNAFIADDTAEIVQSLITSAGRSLSVLQLGGQSHVPPLGNAISPQSISRLNEALSRNRQQTNDTKRPAATIQFDPVKLRQALGYAAMPVPVPYPGRMHPDCVPMHPQLMKPFPSAMPNTLQSAGGNFACFAPQQPHQQPQFFMCTPLAGPAVYGACTTSNATIQHPYQAVSTPNGPSPPPMYFAPTNAAAPFPYQQQQVLMQNFQGSFPSQFAPSVPLVPQQPCPVPYANPTNTMYGAPSAIPTMHTKGTQPHMGHQQRGNKTPPSYAATHGGGNAPSPQQRNMGMPMPMFVDCGIAQHGAANGGGFIGDAIAPNMASANSGGSGYRPSPFDSHNPMNTFGAIGDGLGSGAAAGNAFSPISQGMGAAYYGIDYMI